MNKAIATTKENFEKMLYKEALKTGFFEYQVRNGNQQIYLRT